MLAENVDCAWPGFKKEFGSQKNSPLETLTANVPKPPGRSTLSIALSLAVFLAPFGLS
jgi:hypothetical protein